MIAGCIMFRFRTLLLGNAFIIVFSFRKEGVQMKKNDFLSGGQARSLCSRNKKNKPVHLFILGGAGVPPVSLPLSLVLAARESVSNLFLTLRP
ncbi:hypothetical protein A3I35_00360 [Candidatus Falkowbacteria bacterium RIFCSPLOWO2_02_FULL_45_15]|nr:MAG: hypothetical protein A3I35_00360 [Candidatus Falkowbacteria bacterium RIFCSPLOWO2_02_FULL_45_15]OGF19712.1 MAG: hypothetical protein A3D54_02280 [Candidatus Falkowbacteria bacterium RIFCSPHIGHO2_02_FULL_45_15]